MKSKKRLIGTSGDASSVFLRFNDFREDGNLDFNIVAMVWDAENKKWQTNWKTTTLTPWLPDDVGMLMVRGGWGELEIASSISRDEFDPDNSKDVFVFVAKG
jgi:hypothetical protein